MKNDAGEQGPALQRLFHANLLRFFKNSNHQNISSVNARASNLFWTCFSHFWHSVSCSPKIGHVMAYMQAQDPFHTTVEKFENCVFGHPDAQMFPVDTTRGNLTTHPLLVTWNFLFLGQGSHMITVTSWFSEIFVLKLKRQTSVLKSPVLKSDLEKLCFRDGIVWTAGRTVKKKAALSHFPCAVFGGA